MMSVNKAGADWLALRGHIKKEIELLRDDLERVGAGDFQRGQIASLRKLIAEVEPDFVPAEDSDNYTQDPT